MQTIGFRSSKMLKDRLTTDSGTAVIILHYYLHNHHHHHHHRFDAPSSFSLFSPSRCFFLATPCLATTQPGRLRTLNCSKASPEWVAEEMVVVEERDPGTILHSRRNEPVHHLEVLLRERCPCILRARHPVLRDHSLDHDVRDHGPIEEDDEVLGRMVGRCQTRAQGQSQCRRR